MMCVYMKDQNWIWSFQMTKGTKRRFMCVINVLIWETRLGVHIYSPTPWHVAISLAFLAIKQMIAYSARNAFDDKEKLIKQRMSFNDNFKCFKYIFLSSLPSFTCCNKNLTFITKTILFFHFFFDFPLKEKRKSRRTKSEKSEWIAET